MSVDLAEEIRAAFAERAQSVQSDPDRILERLRSPAGRPNRRRPMLAVAASVIVVAAVAAAVAALHESASREPSGVVGAPVAGPYPQWGPARGQLASDSHFLGTVRLEVANPTGQEDSSRRFSRPRASGPLQILWAGRTPVGAAAVTAQTVREHTAGEDLDSVMVSMLATDTAGRLRMMHRNLTNLSAAAGLLRELGFMASPEGRYLVVIPPHSSDRVQVTPHGARNDCGACRRWSAARVVDGAAVIDLGVGNLGLDALYAVGKGVPTDVKLPFLWY